MSTYLHLECRAHEPAISSDGEVGQHLYDLPNIREYIKHRASLVEVWELAGVDLSSWASNATRFFANHPHCPVFIADEYGQDHPIEIKEES